MDNIQRDLVELLTRNKVEHTTMTRAEAEQWVTAIRNAFANPGMKSSALWEALEESTSYYKEAGTIAARKHLSEIDGPVILLIDDWHGYSAIELRSGPDLSNALEENYDFVWYVTTTSVDRVLCRNDHEFVIFCSR